MKSVTRTRVAVLEARLQESQDVIKSLRRDIKLVLIAFCVALFFL